MKKQYSYFFFENFDAEKEANNPLNPRNVDKRNLDLIISTVADNEIVYQLERILEDSLMDEIVEVLYGVGNLRITSIMHGVSIKEIANECWHILFGSMNEKLVQSGFVAAPPYKINEGRYLQAIELF